MATRTKTFLWTTVAGLLALGAAGLAARTWAAEETQPVKAKNKTVSNVGDKKDLIDYNDADATSPESVTPVGQGVKVASKTFTPPGTMKFKTFPNKTTYVDIQTDPGGLPADRDRESPSEIRVSVTAMPETAGQYPLAAEGNLVPSGGHSTPPELHWSAKVAKAKVVLKEVHFRGFTGATGLRMKNHDTAETELLPPEWEDTDWDCIPDKNEPGAFKRSQTFKVKAVFEVEGADPTHIRVWATGGFGGLNSVTSPVTLDSNGAGVFTINTAPTKIEYHENLAWQWRWKFVNSDEPYLTTLSKHTICITAKDPVPVDQPVYKWVMIPSCKSCNGLDPSGDDWDKQVADRLFLYFEANAKVDGQKLTYEFDTAWEHVGQLLANGNGRCGAWEEYFLHQARAQGVSSLAGRGFYLRWHYPTNFPLEHKWSGLYTDTPGVNNTEPTETYPVYKVAPNRYSQSGTEAGATAWADRTNVQPAPKGWLFGNHAIVMLQKGTTTYLYDPSFLVGPVELQGFSIPDRDTYANYAPSHVLRVNYLDKAGMPFDYIIGEIKWSEYPGGGDAIDLGFVPVGDESDPPGKPTEMRLLWK